MATGSKGNAFDVGSGASVFSRDSAFRPNRDGLSKGQRATLTVEQRKSEQGWCPGVIWGLSARADQQVRLPRKKGG